MTLIIVVMDASFYLRYCITLGETTNTLLDYSIDDEDYIFYLERENFKIAGNDPLSLLAISYINDSDMQLPKEQHDLLVNQFDAIAINFILQKKFRINVTSAYSSNGYDWVGKKKDQIYYAGSVLKLLGLILLVECFGLILKMEF